MEPNYHKGDLVIARKRERYDIEDIIVYAHPEIGPVFHRIIDREGERFILKGDNNAWRDSYHPTQEDIFGKLWLHIHRAGHFIASLRNPSYLVLFSLVVAGLVVITVFNRQSDSPKRHRGRRMKRKKNLKASGVGSQEGRLEILLVIGVFFLVSLILGAFAFTRPTSLKIADDLQYQHIGNLIYSAQDTQDVYDTERIQTGEPVFLELACDVDLAYEYELLVLGGEIAPTDVFQGTGRVSVRISDPNGWNRTLQLFPLAEFSGQQVVLKMGLDLCKVREMIAHKETVTGVSDRWYDLTIMPEIFIQGEVDAQNFHDIFSPVISFQLDSLLMRVSSYEESDPLTPKKLGTIPRFSNETNMLSILGVAVPVLGARWASGMLFSLALGLGAWLGWPVYQDWQKGDAARIQIQYRPMLIDIRGESLTSSDHHFVEVASFQELSKLAERYGAVILHEVRGRFHRYLVQDGDTVYRYALDGVDPDAIFPNFNEFKRALRQAIANQELQLTYQSILDMATEEVLGFEVLLRWNHPEHGIIYPGDFIVRAEEGDLINEIDDWVIEKVCRQAHEWQEMDISFGKLSLNLSYHRFAQPAVAVWFADILGEIGCDPTSFQLEINKANKVMQNEVALENLRELGKMGIHLAIDNFATAEANQIDHLSRLPVKWVKIDRSVIQNPQDTPLVNAVVKMSEGLGLRVVAHGVETEEQMIFLKEHAIDAVQGYFLSHPVPAEDVPGLLAKEDLE